MSFIKMRDSILKRQGLGITLFFLLASINVQSQEWQPWSEWEQSSFDEDLSYRQRIKYTTSDTYALQLEWRNQSKNDVYIEFEVRDRENIREKKTLKIPGETTRFMYGGTSFKSNHIEFKILNYSIGEIENKLIQRGRNNCPLEHHQLGF